MEQRTKEWFKARWGLATASRFSDVLAVGRASYNNYVTEKVIERLTAPPSEDDGYKNAAMQWGIDHEPTAKLAYELEKGVEVKEAFFEKHPKLEAGASPDGYVGDDGLIEIKCPNTGTHLKTIQTDTIPTKYMAQIQGQIWITGRKWCDYISYDPRMPANAQLYIQRVYKDREYIKQLDKAIRLFLKRVEKETKFVKEFKNG